MLLVSVHTAAHSESVDLQGICDLSLTTASTSHLHHPPQAHSAKCSIEIPAVFLPGVWWFPLLCIFSSFYVEKRARVRISVSAAMAQEVMMTSWPGG